MQGKNERQWKKVNENTYDFSSKKRSTKKFLEVSRCNSAKQRQGKNERQWKKVNENTYDFSSKKRSTKKFLEVSRCNSAKQRQRNVQKKCAASAKLLFLVIRPIV